MPAEPHNSSPLLSVPHDVVCSILSKVPFPQLLRSMNCRHFLALIIKLLGVNQTCKRLHNLVSSGTVFNHKSFEERKSEAVEHIRKLFYLPRRKRKYPCCNGPEDPRILATEFMDRHGLSTAFMYWATFELLQTQNHECGIFVDTEKCLDYLNKAMEKEPTRYAYGAIMRAQLLQKMGRDEEAMDEYEHIINIVEVVGIPDLFFFKAEALVNLGRRIEAIQFLADVITSFSALEEEGMHIDERYHEYLIKLLLEEGWLEDALHIATHCCTTFGIDTEMPPIKGILCKALLEIHFELWPEVEQTLRDLQHYGEVGFTHHVVWEKIIRSVMHYIQSKEVPNMKSLPDKHKSIELGDALPIFYRLMQDFKLPWGIENALNCVLNRFMKTIA